MRGGGEKTVAVLIRTAAGETLASLARLVTESYGDDGVLTPDRLADVIRVADIDLAHSLAARDEETGADVGVALLGRRGNRGWLGEFAVAPAWRRQGVGERLLASVMDEARRAGIRRIEFDVWGSRAPAIRLYELMGYRRSRLYLGFTATGADLGLGHGRTPGTGIAGQVEECGVDTLIRWYAETSRTEPFPCWERELPSMLAATVLRCFSVRADGAEQGLICFEATPSDAGAQEPPRVRLLYAGLGPGDGDGHLWALLAAAARVAAGDDARDIGTVAFRVGLEPEGSRLAHLLTRAGFKRDEMPTHEMAIEL